MNVRQVTHGREICCQIILIKEGASMQQSGSQGQSQGKRSPVVVGIGAAVVAATVTLVVLLSNSPQVSTTDQFASVTKQCTLMQRRLLVATEHGGGTVRFRASGWLSQPFTLTNQPQVVIFPLPRPGDAPVSEPISVEGNATNVVITSEVTDLHQVFDVPGAYTYTVTWAPRKSC
jgi:hypothetical protein